MSFQDPATAFILTGVSLVICMVNCSTTIRIGLLLPTVLKDQIQRVDSSPVDLMPDELEVVMRQRNLFVLLCMSMFCSITSWLCASTTTSGWATAVVVPLIALMWAMCTKGLPDLIAYGRHQFSQRHN